MLKRRLATGLLGGTLLLAGAAGLLGSTAQQSEGGYFGTPAKRFHTPANALVSDEVEVENGQPGDPAFDVGELARVRIRVEGQNPGAGIFVGIGPKRDVDAYLRQMEHDRMSAVKMDPFRVDFQRVPGGTSPARPDAQRFWVATASGAGERTLSWDKTRGAWSIIAMNADGTPGVTIEADMGLRFGFLLPAGIGLTVGGLALLAVTVVGVRADRKTTG